MRKLRNDNNLTMLLFNTWPNYLSRQIQCLILVFLLALLISTSVTASANADGNSPGKFIEVLGQRAVNVLSDKGNVEFSKREAAFRKLLVDGFHMPTISRFVVGRYWRSANEQQRRDYKAIFVDFITRVYAARFNSYNGEIFEVVQVIKEQETPDTIVRTQIKRPSGGAPIGVDYRVRKISNSYKVVDVNVEGISMLHTHRVEFASVINRKGFDGFLEMLKARVNAPVDETGS